jgi:hypothetical protein
MLFYAPTRKEFAMKCKANENGWNGSFISEGQVFESKKCPSWATPVNAPKAEKPAKNEEMIALRAKAKELGYASAHLAGRVKLENVIKEAEEAAEAKKLADEKADEADEAQKLADKEAKEAEEAKK